ncbi:MAG: aldo/keto reductase [Thermoplasmata archaeon]|nr:aldo/keto reductase [Thermoplasmata archaeon]
MPRSEVDLTVIGFEVTPAGGIDRILDPVPLVRPWRSAFDVGVRFVEGLWLAPVHEGLEVTLGRESHRVPTVVASSIARLSEEPGPPAPVGSSDTPARLELVRRPSRTTLDRIGRMTSHRSSRNDGELAVVGACWPTVAEAESGVPDAVGRGIPIVAFPANLNDYGRSKALCEGAHDAGVGVIALDPFSGGRLDGSFLEGPEGLGPSLRPESIEELARRLAPVRELGFLTADRHRTLAEAALRGVLDLPGVLSTSVSFRSPGIEATVARLDRVPAFSPSETERLETLRRVPT